MTANLLRIATTDFEAEEQLRALPWAQPLADWPSHYLAALPRGLSRHVVRFVNFAGRVLAVKEINEDLAHREYALLEDLAELPVPSVRPLAVVSGRTTAAGERLNAALVTEHLNFSLPYRALFHQALTHETGMRLMDALAVLLVQLHLLGFFWGDVSLSNALFRRDADAFSAYLVDAETAEKHEQLSDGQRRYDLDLARINIIGELMDLQAGQYLAEDVNVVDVGDHVVERYSLLWDEITTAQVVPTAQRRWKVEEKIARLNQLGFSVGALTVNSEPGGTSISIRPKVVDAGHCHQQIKRLTGMEVGELQARRMLDDMKTYRAVNGLNSEPLAVVARMWLRDVFDPVIEAIPPELGGKLEKAQLFHEVLDHRWFMAQNRQANVPMSEVITSYLVNVLPAKRDEVIFLDADPIHPSGLIHPSGGHANNSAQ